VKAKAALATCCSILNEIFAQPNQIINCVIPANNLIT